MAFYALPPRRKSMALPAAAPAAPAQAVALQRDQKSFSEAFQVEIEDLLQKANEVDKNLDEGLQRALTLCDQKRQIEAEMEAVQARNEACEESRKSLNERLHLLNKEMDLQENDIQKMRAEKTDEELVNRLQRELDQARGVAREVAGKITHCGECSKQCKSMDHREEEDRPAPVVDPAPLRPFVPELSTIVVDL